MARKDEILVHLPRLRRHARLLSGSQAVGDEFVRLCLEAVVAEPGWLKGDNARVQLFRAFHAAWTRVQATIAEPPTLASVELKDRVESSLGALPGTERRALLLVVTEEFTYEQTAFILDLTVGEVRDAIARARKVVFARVSVPVLIVEDEPIVAADVGRIVGEMGHRVVATVPHQNEAVARARELKPGLVLVDLRLEGDGDGVEAAHDILQSYAVPIVFVTGYPERLLTGGNLEPAFVIAKPFDVEALKVTIAQALTMYESTIEAARHRQDLLAKLKEITGRGLAQPVS